MGGAAPETPPEKPAQPGTPGAGKAEQRVHVAVGVILSIAIVGMLNYLAFRHYKRFDWTEDRLFTVSERTVEVLRGLDRPIDVYNHGDHQRERRCQDRRVRDELVNGIERGLPHLLALGAGDAQGGRDLLESDDVLAVAQ